MSEARLLSLVLRYSHPTALARRVRDGSVIAALRRLEDRGLEREGRTGSRHAAATSSR